jgi:hypothetical protein
MRRPNPFSQLNLPLIVISVAPLIISQSSYLKCVGELDLSKVLEARFALPYDDERRTYVNRHVASWLDEFSGRFVECFAALQVITALLLTFYCLL